ncbi:MULTISPECIES: DUF4157 domain-containing protein [Actinomycetes]|uniref:eCIS core domain-containing protein n=1 Tax=Actinomycetes TaxID=1760 RepID=UPI00131A2541|nr:MULTISPECIES: DUF4157 domain-containing protein [Actinomycetes]
MPDIVPEELREPGRPLDQAVRARAEADLHWDFSRVRVHTGDRAASSARAIGATAYTLGQNIVFGAGRYAPGTAEGNRLLRHELIHVRQQPVGSPSRPLRLGDPHAPAEQQADLVDAAGVIRRQTDPESLTREQILDLFGQSTSKEDFILKLGLGPVSDSRLASYLLGKGFTPAREREDPAIAAMPHADPGRPGDEIVGRVIQRESPDMMGFVGTYERGTARELDQRQEQANEQTNLMIMGNFISVLGAVHQNTITPRMGEVQVEHQAAPAPRSAAGRRLAQALGPGPGPRPIPGATEFPQARELAVSSLRLLGEYEQLANAKLPGIVTELTKNPRETSNRVRLASLGADFQALMNEVGDAATLNPSQRRRAEAILSEARPLGKQQYANLRGRITNQLREDEQLKGIAQQLVRRGDAIDDGRGALKVRIKDKNTGTISYEPLNLEHRIRETDNPWATKLPGNLAVTDAPQNQQYLESLRELGSIWPSGDRVESFVVKHGLNKEGVDFRPGAR